MLNRCEKIYKDGEVRVLEDSDKERIMNKNYTMAEKALRVIAVAYLDVDNINKNEKDEKIESNLVFVRTCWNDRSAKRRSKKCN